VLIWQRFFGHTLANSQHCRQQAAGGPVIAQLPKMNADQIRRLRRWGIATLRTRN
jgi:hypothetical protein